MKCIKITLLVLAGVVLSFDCARGESLHLPAPIVKLAFDEPTGLTAIDTGTAGAQFTLTAPLPRRTRIVPTNVGGPRAIDMGTASGHYGVDSAAPIPALGGLTKFTITAWVNNRDIAQGSGGNRIVTWLGLDLNGAELVYRGDGSLMLAVNEEPSFARSSTGMIPADFAASQSNWRFLAVTYDATVERVQFYFGSNASDALPDRTVSYPGHGAVGSATGRLAVGHLNPERRSGRENRIFRGLIDQVQIFGDVLSPLEIVAVQREATGLPPLPTIPVAAFTGTITRGSVPLLVTFTDVSTGLITNRFWNFGDGFTTNTTAVGISHDYTSPATNTVSLTVFGPGGSNTLTRQAYVAVTNLPTAGPGGQGPLTRVRNDTLRMPESPPRSGFTTVNALGGLSFTYPIAIASPPGETNRLFVAEQGGRIIVITNLASPTRTVFLDLSGIVQGGTPGQEQGLLSLAFHPGYATNRSFFLVYVLNQNLPGGNGYYNRLSRFLASPLNPDQALVESERVLIDQNDQEFSHNMNDVRFGPDGYLYVALGNEGHPNDAFSNSQRIDKDFFSGVLRLDVDKRSGNLPPNPHPASSTNYAVPADNPFVGATSFNGQPVTPSQVRTEFYSVGLRNPWRIVFDAETGLLYCGDVGQEEYEEINILTKGGNYGWAFREGFEPGPNGTPATVGALLAPALAYGHGLTAFKGHAVVAGLVYRGSRLSQIHGAFIFSDYVSGNIWQLRYNGTNVSNWERLCFDKDIASFGADPRNGDVLMCDIIEGRIKRLEYDSGSPTGPALPPTLAHTGAFADLQTLTPNPGIVPYGLNVPFWSDGAGKARWFSVPNPNSRIGFRADGNWSFPTGTVWIKHFDLQLTNGVPSSSRRLETRLLVKNATGVYGVTYRWAGTPTNATLVADEGFDEPFLISDGGTVRTQIWHYPSRVECLNCHTPVGGYALGFNTPQLNRRFSYDGSTTNQIQALSDAGYFHSPVSSPETMLALAAADDTAASLEHRARSYLFANCAQCHQPGGSGRGLWDARIATPLAAAGLINCLVVEQGSNSAQRVIKPGDLIHSMLLTRISSPPPRRMPPLATSEFDTQSMALIRDWIGSLLKILPLGDSITSGDRTHDSYRRPLWQMLTNAGLYPDFVGSLHSNAGGGPPHPDFDLDHEGHTGWRANELLASLPNWLLGYTPDVCLLHAGSNDAFQNETTDSTLAELNQIIQALRVDNPRVIVLLAKVIPCEEPTARQKIIDLNSQIDGLAALTTTAASPVIVVDQYTVFDVAADTYDGVHPNESGDFKMAQKWFAALQAVLAAAGDMPVPPAPPTALQAAAGDHRVTLTWSPSDGATGYNVKRSTIHGAHYSLVASNLSATTYTDLSAVNGVAYFYVVTALKAGAESSESALASATPGSGAIPIVKLSFDEISGTLTPNFGSAGGNFTLTTPRPTHSANVPTKVGGDRAMDMGNSAGDQAADSPAPISALANLSRLTLTAWLNNRSIVQGSGGNRVVSCIDDGGDGFELIYKSDGSLIFTMNQRPDSDSPRSSAGRIPQDHLTGPDNWRFVAVTYDSDSGHVQYYFGSNASDATLDVVTDYPGRGPVGQGLGRLSIGHMNPATRAANASRTFRGLIDEARIFGSVLSPGEIVAVQRESLMAFGPVSQITCPESSVMLVTTAFGATPFTYQWLLNGTPIQGATNSSYSIPSVVPAHAGAYCVRVAGRVESVTNCATLTMLTNTTATELTSLALCPGVSGIFTTTASGTGPFSYRWTKNGAPITGATNDSYTLPPASAAVAATYCVEVAGQCNTVTNCATLTMIADQDLLPRIIGLALADGYVRLQVSGCAGQPYRILASDTLFAGSPVSTNVADANGAFEFTEPVRRDAPARFYRVVTP